MALKIVRIRVRDSLTAALGMLETIRILLKKKYNARTIFMAAPNVISHFYIIYLILLGTVQEGKMYHERGSSKQSYTP